jgi:acetyltransferase-like isoleucine patch superfamily enzyme
VVGDCCHIGAQSIILPSVRIGRRCVVAANSLVNRDVADDCVVAGNPAVAIGHVEGEGADARVVIANASEGSSTLMRR